MIHNKSLPTFQPHALTSAEYNWYIHIVWWLNSYMCIDDFETLCVARYIHASGSGPLLATLLIKTPDWVETFG